MGERKKGKTGYDKNALQDILSNAEFCPIDKYGKTHPPAHKVFQTIADLMLSKGSKITPKHVHTIINNNRNGFKTHVLKIFNIKEKELSRCIDDGDFTMHLNADEKSIDGVSAITIDISLVISPEKWHSIRPEEKMYGNRVYWKLRAGWADVLAEAIWVQHHVDCVFAFKNNTVYRTANARNYLAFHGSCIECESKISGSLLKKPADNVDVILKCHIEGIISEAHSNNKRRHLSGNRRRDMADKMIHERKDPVILRRQEARRLKPFAGKDPPILPTTAVLRKAKEERLMEKRGFNFATPALNLLDVSEHCQCVGSIHLVALKRFSCVYWLPEQMQIYQARCLKDPNAVFVIDATGGITKRSKSREPHTFLYQCMLATGEGSVPTFQMVSADHRALHIAHFLRLILAENAPIPPIVVTDFGWALLIAVSTIFGKCSSLQDYLQKCHDAVKLKSTTLPSTYMRLDVSHMIAMIARWKCLKGKGMVGRFYKRCIAKACRISCIEELTTFVESILSVTLSRYIGSTQLTLPSEEKLLYLNEKIRGVSLKKTDSNSDGTVIEDQCDEESDEESVDDNKDAGDNSKNKKLKESVLDSEDEDELEHSRNSKTAKTVTGKIKDIDRDLPREEILEEVNKCGELDEIGCRNSSWKQWIDEVQKEAKVNADLSSKGNMINAYYNPELAAKLIKQLLPYVALWTGIMRPIFGRGSEVATSAFVESEFSDIKNRCFKGQLPIRVDGFVVDHLKHIDDKITSSSNESDLTEERSVRPKAGSRRDDRRGTTGQSTINSDISFDIADQILCSTPQTSHPEMEEVRIAEEKTVASVESVEDTVESSVIEEQGPQSRVSEVEESLNEDSKVTVKDATFCIEGNGGADTAKMVMKSCDITPPRMDDNIKASNEWVVQEEWGGYNKNIKEDSEIDEPPKTKRLKPSYLDDVPEWDCIKNAKTGRMPMFLNGNISSPIPIDGKKLNIRLTCAFDSIFQVTLSALSANKTYREQLETSDCPLVLLCCDVINAKKITKKYYVHRGRILKETGIFEIQKYTRTIEQLNAKCNAAHLAQFLFIEEPSYRYDVSCSCGYTNSRELPLLEVNVDILLCGGLHRMKEAIEDAMQVGRTCFRCKKKAVCVTKYGRNVLVDTSVVTDKSYPNRDNIAAHSLDTIKKVFAIDGNTYMLVGVVHFVDNHEHYVAYTLAGVYWYMYDDFQKKPVVVTAKTKIQPHVIMYTLCENKV